MNQVFFDAAVEHWISVCRNEGEVIVRNVLTGEVTASIRAHRDRVESACVSACGKFLATGSNDGTAKVWGMPSGCELASVHGMTGGVGSLAFSASAQIMATGASEGGTIVLWSATDGTEIARLEGHGGAVVSLQFAPGDSELLSASWDGTARVWDLACGAMRTLMRPEGDRRYAMRRAQYIFDGAALVTFADDGVASVWDARSGGLITSLRGGGLFQKFHSFALAPKCTKIALANSLSKGRCISFWDVARARAYTSDAAILLAAHLTRGRGQLPASERAHLLLEGAPTDLHAALLAQLDETRRADVTSCALEIERCPTATSVFPLGAF